MKSLGNTFLSLVLGMGSCSNLSSSPEGLEARVVSGSDIDLPANNYGTSLPDPAKDNLQDTVQTNDVNDTLFTYLPRIRSQQYFLTTVEDHYSFDPPLTGLGRLREIKDFASREGYATQLVDEDGYLLSVCDKGDSLLEDVCELILIQSEEAQLAIYKENDSGNSSVMTILGYNKNFGDGLVPVFFDPEVMFTSSSSSSGF